MSEGIELVIHSLDRERTFYELVKICARLRPERISVDVGGRGKMLLEELRAVGLPAQALDKGRKAELRRFEDGRPFFIEGPDDELADSFRPDEWLGQYRITTWNGVPRAYEFTEVKNPPSGVVTLRWVRVTDPAVLKKLRIA